MAELPDGIAPSELATRARKAAIARWQGYATDVFEEYRRIARSDIWQEQVNDVIEFYAAWVPLEPADYSNQRRRLNRLLAGRKNCRNFLQAHGHDGVPKSSLDGLRETVLQENREQWPTGLRRRLRVREGEQLDVIGLVKRTSEGTRHYPSVSRIAADPWVRGIARQGGGNGPLQRLTALCAALEADRVLHRLNLERFHQDYGVFPFEGTALYRSRHHELQEETETTEDSVVQLGLALREVEGLARRLGLGSEPDPYLAILVADGDRMGEALSRLASPEAHRRFSAELARFAGRAEMIVRDHHGVLVYSGGDDVLAFLPLDQCLDCATKLSEAFQQIMAQALEGQRDALPTLSVGLAIAHLLENLEDLLNFGRAAEKAAKQPDRNGLAIHLHKRGGSPVKVRRRWTDNLHTRLPQYARWFLARALSNRTPYELVRLADVYDGWQGGSLADAIQCDAIRVIERKRPGGESQMGEIGTAIHDRVKTADDLRALAAELLIARQFAVALRQRGQAVQNSLLEEIP